MKNKNIINLDNRCYCSESNNKGVGKYMIFRFHRSGLINILKTQFFCLIPFYFCRYSNMVGSRARQLCLAQELYLPEYTEL